MFSTSFLDKREKLESALSQIDKMHQVVYKPYFDKCINSLQGMGLWQHNRFYGEEDNAVFNEHCREIKNFLIDLPELANRITLNLAQKQALFDMLSEINNYFVNFCPNTDYYNFRCQRLYNLMLKLYELCDHMDNKPNFLSLLPERIIKLVKDHPQESPELSQLLLKIPTKNSQGIFKKLNIEVEKKVVMPESKIVSLEVELDGIKQALSKLVHSVKNETDKIVSVDDSKKEKDAVAILKRLHQVSASLMEFRQVVSKTIDEAQNHVTDKMTLHFQTQTPAALTNQVHKDNTAVAKDREVLIKTLMAP